MKFSSKLLWVGLACLLALRARADTYTFVDWGLEGLYQYKYLNASSSTSNSYTDTWNINGVNPAYRSWPNDLQVVSVVADFWFADDGNDPDTKTYWVSACKKWVPRCYDSQRHCWVPGHWETTVGHYVTVDNPSNYELVDITVGGQLIDDNIEVDGTISFTTNLVYYDQITNDLSSNIAIVADVQADGLLQYVVKAVQGDTYLKETRLTVIAENPPAVPDGGMTLVYLGLASVALALFGLRGRRRIPAG